MSALYQLLVLGTPDHAELKELREQVEKIVESFELTFNEEVEWLDRPDSYEAQQLTAIAAVYYCAKHADSSQEELLEELLTSSVPVLPIVAGIDSVSRVVPTSLAAFNCIDSTTESIQRIATALLECVGLLPRQRRVFLSYRRTEAREAALQLFDVLSARHYDVFLDTHGVPPAEDFQAMLWHRLCDSDVLIMLDTPTYFDSRWTSAEYGRALAKGIAVLRVGWPDIDVSIRTETAATVSLQSDELDTTCGRLSDDAVLRICHKLEQERSKSIAVRRLQLLSKIRNAIERIGGAVLGINGSKIIYADLADGRQVALSPAVGVPSAVTLNEAFENNDGKRVAVVYEHTGLHKDWMSHIDWLGQHVRCTCWVKADELDWQFADWED